MTINSEPNIPIKNSPILTPLSPYLEAFNQPESSRYPLTTLPLEKLNTFFYQYTQITPYEEMLFTVNASLANLYIEQLNSLRYEIEVISTLDHSSITFVGAGPLPYTSIVLNRMFHIPIESLERVKFFYKAGRRVLKMLGISEQDVRIVCAEGADYAYPLKDSTLFLALNVIGKDAVVSQVLRTGWKGKQLIIRRPSNPEDDREFSPEVLQELGQNRFREYCIEMPHDPHYYLSVYCR